MAVTRDGGTRQGARVNKLGMSHVVDVSYGLDEYYSDKGNAYNFNTGTITLTSGNASGVAYIENGEDDQLIITAFFYLLGNTTGGSSASEHLVEIIRNPTAVSFSTVQAPVNRNFSSFNTLSNSTFFKGAEAATVTGGTVAIESIFSGEGRQVLSVGSVVLAKGNSCAIRITPKTSNTSMAAQFAAGMYLDKDGLLGG